MHSCLSVAVVVFTYRLVASFSYNQTSSPPPLCLFEIFNLFLYIRLGTLGVCEALHSAIATSQSIDCTLLTHSYISFRDHFNQTSFIASEDTSRVDLVDSFIFPIILNDAACLRQNALS